MTTVDIIETTSPIGDITLAVRGARLCALNFTDRWARRRTQLESRFRGAEFRRAREAEGIVRRLRDYFDGDLAALEVIDVDPAGTAFQQKVWSELRSVGPGQTISYGALARRVGAPAAARAVGAANGANPIAIIIPCHRVIGSNGSLTGYGGGMERKRWLLDHERRAHPSAGMELPFAGHAG